MQLYLSHVQGTTRIRKKPNKPGNALNFIHDFLPPNVTHKSQPRYLKTKFRQKTNKHSVIRHVLILIPCTPLWCARTGNAHPIKPDSRCVKLPVFIRGVYRNVVKSLSMV